jgi:amino acid adenylation domain-containing protein
MNAYELLDILNRGAVSLAIEGDALRCKAPRGFMTPDLLDGLKRHKQEIIAILGGSRADGDVIPWRPKEETDLPLSFAQQRLWVLDQVEPGNPFYNNPVAIWLRGALDAAALAEAVNGVVRRHETLRTTFHAVDGEARQSIRSNLAIPVEITDLSGLPAEEARRRAEQATEEDGRAAFDLSRGPLIRSRLLKLADDAHLWLLNVHHIVADGWSMGILLREIGALYAAGVQGQPSPLADLPVQYGDYARWQRQALGGDAVQDQIGYWMQRLAGAPALLELPADRPRPAVQSYRGARLGITVGADTLHRLHDLGRQTQSTLFMTLTAALSVLLWRYSGQPDICIGTPFANRGRSALEPLIGCFVNTLVIRTRLDPALGFTELLRQVHGHVLDAYANHDAPFEQVIEAVKPERHTGHSPLFQVMLALQNAPGGGLVLPGLVGQSLDTGSGTAKFDLSLDVTETGGTLRIVLEYSTDLFDAERMQRLAGSFCRLLENIAADPEAGIGRVGLLTQAEQEQLAGWSRTDTPLPDACAHELFEGAARSAPEAVAIVHEGGVLGYGALNAAANRLARHLRRLGVGPDDRVAVCLERSPELVLGLLAVLKAGGAYVPLDAEYPAERLAYMVSDSRPSVALTHGAAREVLEAAVAGLPERPAVIDLEADAGHWSEEADADLDRGGLEPRHLAYVIYTSGSTGRPKGVMVEHRSLVNFLLWSCSAYGERPVLLQKAPCSFDASVWELFWPLAGGGRLVLARPGGQREPDYLAALIRSAGVTAVHFVPALLELFLEEPSTSDCCSGLTDVFGGGEELTPTLARRCASVLPGARLHNLYGPTEATVVAMAWTADADAPGPVPIGRPVSNTQVHVLDARGEPVPVGVAGELHIGGAGLARGYWNRPDLTAERFVSGGPEGRLYRTGDHVRWRADGALEYLGRGDQQLKVRGHRTELGEIEARLREHPSVREAVVVARDDGGGDRRLVGYVTIRDGAGLAAEDLRSHLAALLPDVMVPSALLVLPALPLLPNGKIDRSALPEPGESTGLRPVNLASPRDRIELQLYQIWKSLLLQPTIGIGDSFFDVGGSSISAIKLAHRIGQTFGVSLPVREIISHPTIEALGGRIRRGSGPIASQSNLIVFRPGDGRCNVVCIHPAGGTAFCYLSLAKALPEDYGVYGVQSPGVNPGESFLPTVEAMAGSYLERIAPLLSAPLVITGLSFGGLVAYEMARLLHRAGRQQVSAVLLDTQGSDDPQYRAVMAPVEFAEFRQKLVRFNGMYPGIDDRQIEQYFHIYNHNRSSVRDYVCPPEAGRVVLVQAHGEHSRLELRQMRRFWRRRAAAGYLVKLVHGAHWEMLETAEIRRVSRTIQSEMARFDRSARGLQVRELEALQNA